MPPETFHVGMLDERVTLERATRTSDGRGGATLSWATYDTVWAHVRPMTGREREAAERPEATANYLIVLRNRTDVLESDRIGWGTRKLNIRFIRSKGNRTSFLEIEAELGAASR